MVDSPMFAKGLLQLKEALVQPFSEIVRDATLQRFEYCFELGWKALRGYLLQSHGLRVNSPKAVFREALSVELLSSGETEQFLEMTDARNLTTDTYDKTMAEQIYQQIKEKYYPLLEQLQKRIETYV